MHRMLQVPGHMLRGERDVLVPNRNFLGAKWLGAYQIPWGCEQVCTTCCNLFGQTLTDEAPPKVEPVATVNTAPVQPANMGGN